VKVSRTSLLLATIALTLAMMAVFTLWPELDLRVARAFYGTGGFGGRAVSARVARAFFNVTPFVVLAACAALYGLRRAGVSVAYAPSGRALSFLIATMVVGPGLVVNLGLKDHAHRPRPVQTIEFGGKFDYRSWRQFDGACPKNCSFVSGEASEAFWMVAPASLVPPPLRGLAIGAALGFGLAASVVRMAVGGHYLSDVTLAALLTLIIVEAAHMIFFLSARPRRAPGAANPETEQSTSRDVAPNTRQ
jgi:membrane-associated PAP2 superfamily phosphatase